MLPFPSFEIFIIGFVVVANIVLGSVVFFHNRRSITGLLFLLFVLVSSLWSIFNYFSYYLSSPFWLLWNMRLVMFFAVYQAYFFFLLMLVFPKEKFFFSKKIRLLLTPLVIIVSLITLTPFLFSGVEKVLDSPSPEVEPGIILFALTAVPLVFGGIFVMLGKLRKADPKTKPQFKTLLLGLALMFLAIVFFNFVLPIFFNVSRFVPFGAVFLFPFIFLTFYAIYKHELLNARVVITELLVLIIIVISFFETLLSEGLVQFVLRSILLILLILLSVLFIKATVREIVQREKLQELTDRLKNLDKQKDEFISMAAHELRAPLTAIKGYVSMILDGDTGEISAKARGFLTDVNSITDRLIRLVNNMLNVSRIEEGRMVFQEEEESLSRLVRAVFNQFAPEAERKGLRYELEIPPQIRDKVWVDPDRLEEVIGNLLSNALKYTDSGFVKVRLTQPDPKTVQFEVSDSGPGISPEEQAKLFQKFHRVETNVGKTTGTGLGLYISKLLIEKFHGKIGLKSKVGKGSTFWFELPLYSLSSRSRNHEN